MATSGWQEAGWSSVKLHAIYDLARWSQCGPNLQMIWFSVCVCVCPDPHRMCRLMPGHAVWIKYTLLKAAQRYLTRACSKEWSERCCFVWFPLQWIRDTNLVVNYESNHWPSSSWGKVSADLMNLDKQPPSLSLLNMSQSRRTKKSFCQQICNYVLK